MVIKKFTKKTIVLKKQNKSIQSMKQGKQEKDIQIQKTLKKLNLFMVNTNRWQHLEERDEPRNHTVLARFRVFSFGQNHDS